MHDTGLGLKGRSCVARLFRRVHKVVLHFTVLLALFGSAGFKAERTPLLACTLLSEFSTLFYLGAKIQVGRKSH